MKIYIALAVDYLIELCFLSLQYKNSSITLSELLSIALFKYASLVFDMFGAETSSAAYNLFDGNCTFAFQVVLPQIISSRYCKDRELVLFSIEMHIYGFYRKKLVHVKWLFLRGNVQDVYRYESNIPTVANMFFKEH